MIFRVTHTGGVNFNQGFVACGESLEVTEANAAEVALVSGAGELLDQDMPAPEAVTQEAPKRKRGRPRKTEIPGASQPGYSESAEEPAAEE